MRFWKRKDASAKATSSRIPKTVAEATLEDLDHSTQAVMWSRDMVAFLVQLNMVHSRPEHDCPTYCISWQMGELLSALDEEQLRMIVLTLIKDLFEYIEQEGDDDDD